MGRLAANVSIALACTMSVCWALIVGLPMGWHRKATIIWNFEVGLYHVSVSRAIGGSLAKGLGFAADKVSSKVQGKSSKSFQNAVGALTEGEESLRWYRDFFCAAESIPITFTNCKPWEFLMWGSWMLIFCTIVTIILLLVASGFWWYYWAHEAKGRHRKIAVGLYVLAPCVQLMGLGGFVGLSLNFGHWLTEFALSSGQLTYTFVFVLACLLWVLTWAPVAVIFCCSRRSEMEDAEEDSDEERSAMMGDYRNAYSGYDEYGNPINADPYSQGGYSPDPYGQGIPYPHEGYPQDSYSQQQAYEQQSWHAY